jgi:hypothetical protein
MRLMSRLLFASVAAEAVLAGLSALPTSIVAQQPPVRTFTRPAAEYAEPYSAVRGVRELADGRVVVTDPRDKVVQLVDFKTGRATTLGREGSGPNEYQMPSGVFALPGDSTLIADPLNSRFLVLGPRGTLAGTWTPAAAAPAGGGDRPAAQTVPARPPAGGGPVVMTMGGGGPMAMLQTRATDAQGRVYTTGSPITMTPEGPKPADSLPLTRVHRATSAADTVAWLQVPKGNTNVSASGGNMNLRIGGGPFAANDGWAVLPDGRVAVVRYQDYHVDVYPASGRAAPARGTPVRFTPVRVTEAEKQAWRDTRSRSGAVAIAMTRTDGPGGSTQQSRAVAPMAEEPTDWPAVMPPFDASRVFAAPNGQLWVGRYQSARDKAPRYDVFDATGKHTGQVVFPADTRVIGFGKGTVYTVRIDEDDLQYLQRWTL